MLSLYNSFVLSHLEYCSPLLLGVGKVQASRLEDANLYILRSILRYGKTISYQELLEIVNMETMQFAFITFISLSKFAISIKSTSL